MTGLHAVECARLRFWLENHGELREADFSHDDPARNVDGGDRITRVAARIHDLKNSGVPVLSRREGRIALYSLQADTAPVLERPAARPSNVYRRRLLCMSCFGTFEKEADACGRGRLEGRQEDARNTVLGCRMPVEQEARRAA